MSRKGRDCIEDSSYRRSKLSLHLSINTKLFRAGDCIEGKVIMLVPETGTHDFSGIYLSMVGYENVKLQRELSETTTLQETYRKVVVQINKEVVSLPPLLIEGQYEYPFCWELPSDKVFPTTMSCSTADSSSCQVQYNLTAFLPSESSAFDGDITIFSRKPIYIVGSGKNGINNSNRRVDGTDVMIAEPKKCKVKSWLKSKGFIEIGLDTYTSVSSPNSMIAVCITGRGNLSSVPVEKLQVQLVETVQWGAYCEDERAQCRVLAEKTVSVKNAPQWQAQQQKNTRGDEESTTAAAGKNHDNNRIMRYITLDNSARDSYEGHFLKVRHSIHVVAITKGHFVNNPEFTTRIEVHQDRLRQNGSSTSSNDPIWANVQISSLPSDDDTNSTDNSDYDRYVENQIRSDIEIPQAVPISDIHSGLGSQLEAQGEVEQYNPDACSTERNVVNSRSGSLSHSILLDEQILEPVHVMAVVE